MIESNPRSNGSLRIRWFKRATCCGSGREKKDWRTSPEACFATNRGQEREMSLKHLTIAALLAVCTFAAQAAAQKNELSGMLGRTFISDQGIIGAPSYD